MNVNNFSGPESRSGDTRSRRLREHLAFLRFPEAYHHTYHSLRWLVLSVIAGVLSGLVAVFYHYAIEGLSWLLMNWIIGLTLPAPAGEAMFTPLAGIYRPWILPIILTAIALFTGWLVNRYIPESFDAGTDGTDTMIRAFHRGAGHIPPKVFLIRGLTSILTISGGGSAGREGPISLLGGGLGSWLGEKFGLSQRDRRIFLLAGAAGGLGAIFRAPLGGAITAIEVLYREDFEAEAILPAVISSVIAYCELTFFYGNAPIFDIPTFAFKDVRELLFYALLAVACAISGRFFLKVFSCIKFRIFLRLRNKLGIVCCTALGGLAMGLLGMVFPDVLSGGYGILEQAIKGNVPIGQMMALVVGKTVATSLTLGSGMSGGMFAPALFVGGMTGGVIGFSAHLLFPSIVVYPGGYVLVGMAAFFTGIASASIGPLVMVCELAQDYHLLAPLMLTSAICLKINRRCSLYENQAETKFHSPAHAGDLTVNVLEELKVKDFFTAKRVMTLEESASFRVMQDVLANTDILTFPVKNGAGEITGILTLQDVRRIVFEEDLCNLVIAKDIAGKPVLLVPEDDLYKSLIVFLEADLSQIPVVNPENRSEILGVLELHDVFNAYKDSVARHIKK